MQGTVVLNAELIERTRLARGMLKADLAEAAKLNIKSVITATKGRAVGVRVARQIAAALDTTVQSLVSDVRPAVPAVPAASAGGAGGVVVCG